MLKIELFTSKVVQSDRLEKYVITKVGRLEKYIPRAARASSHVEVRLKEAKTKAGKRCTCELVIHLPHETLHIGETTEHLYATIDVTVAHARESIAEYKAKHAASRLRRRLGRAFGSSKNPDA